MKFPFIDKVLVINNLSDSWSNKPGVAELPLMPHPGAFGYIRKNHIHEGVDIYCNAGEKVYAIEAGVVVNIQQFTGENVGSAWWHDTWAVMIEGETGVFNYGEIKPLSNFKVGTIVEEGQCLGEVVTVLKNDKGRPMNMLHLELYTHGTRQFIAEWNIGSKQPEILLDPTPILQQFVAQPHKSIKIK